MVRLNSEMEAGDVSRQEPVYPENEFVPGIIEGKTSKRHNSNWVRFCVVSNLLWQEYGNPPPS